MKDLRLRCLLLIGIAILITIGPASATRRQDLGRTEKLRILVDKTLMRANDWYMTEDNVREIRDAGFNVVVPRVGAKDIKRVRRIAQLATRYDMFYMPWLRGTLHAPANADPANLWVASNGTVAKNLYSPNSRHLWMFWRKHIIRYARLSTEYPSLIGVFLDYENYSGFPVGLAYGLSYDSHIMRRFAEAQGINLPELQPDQRYPWLKQHNLHEAFEQYQITYWRRQARRLREEIDAINPTFQFCVYPVAGAKFIREAVYREWSTPKAPIILADACTYQGNAMAPLHSVLEQNRTTLLANMKTASQYADPMMYTGGLDPIYASAYPEFEGKRIRILQPETGRPGKSPSRLPCYLRMPAAY